MIKCALMLTNNNMYFCLRNGTTALPTKRQDVFVHMYLLYQRTKKSSKNLENIYFKTKKCWPNKLIELRDQRRDIGQWTNITLIKKPIARTGPDIVHRPRLDHGCHRRRHHHHCGRHRRCCPSRHCSCRRHGHHHLHRGCHRGISGQQGRQHCPYRSHTNFQRLHQIQEVCRRQNSAPLGTANQATGRNNLPGSHPLCPAHTQITMRV